MTGTRRAAAVVVAASLVLALGACAGRAGAGEPAGQDAIATWSRPAGIAPDLVYVTDVDGFELAVQSVGVVGDDGMSAMYTRPGDDALAVVMLSTWRQPTPDAGPCDELADSSETVPMLRCTVVRGDVHITLDGEAVDAATLRAAAEAVRVPGEGELDDLFAGVRVPGPPVERGDLPPEGDGAPDNSVGAGG